jgi:DNA-directed RNA polymerase specialized sigma24 family protein
MAVNPAEPAARRKWSLTQDAFDALLTALGPDRDHAADRYLELRRNLVRLFEWRGCPAPDEYADETLNRCARKIGEGEEIRDVSTYAIGVARMLVREMGRDHAKYACPLEDAPELRTMPHEIDDEPERRMDCVRNCLAKLTPENRQLILHYYHGEKGDKIQNRKGLTQLFGIGASGLRMRALRLRQSLQLCSENCLQRRQGGVL